MPIGKPTPDGEIVHGSRHYSGGHGSLGRVGMWSCPSCGKQNDGQPLEHGCLHCGAGDQRQGRAGQVEEQPVAKVTAPTVPDRRQLGDTVARSVPPAAPLPSTRILRLLEYVIAPGQDADETLRRSLVGRMTFPWGTLTATIVDSCDSRQEDLLRLARMQPGVWIGNPTTPTPLPPGFISREEGERRALEYFEREHQKDVRKRMEPPDTGPAFSVQDEQIARQLELLGGYRLCYTLALGLQSIADEAGTDPTRFLSTESCLSLANALMQQVPAEWLEGAEPPEDQPAPHTLPGTREDEARIAEVRERIREASTPQPVYREVKNAD